MSLVSLWLMWVEEKEGGRKWVNWRNDWKKREGGIVEECLLYDPLILQTGRWSETSDGRERKENDWDVSQSVPYISVPTGPYFKLFFHYIVGLRLVVEMHDWYSWNYLLVISVNWSPSLLNWQLTMNISEEWRMSEELSHRMLNVSYERYGHGSNTVWKITQSTHIFTISGTYPTHVLTILGFIKATNIKWFWETK